MGFPRSRFRPWCGRVIQRGVIAGFLWILLPGWARAADYVIQISVDGLGSPYLQQALDLGTAPNFARFLAEGSGTLNARTDYDYTITLPGHTTMLTGRPVLDKLGDDTSGHLWTENFETAPPLTLQANRGFYLSSTFDVAHDHGLSTALYSGKPKFSIFDRSYDEDNGAPDLIGEDNGRDKIDVTTITNFDSAAMMDSFLSHMRTSPAEYSFVHFHDTDTAGHEYGWGSGQYATALETVDQYLGQIFSLIDSSPTLAGRTAIVLTSDHGGTAFGHSDQTLPVDYTIPFLVWGSNVAAGQDLYDLNPATRLDPGTDRPDYSLTGLQPIRNGDSGNLALSLLGLNAIPGSSIDNRQDLLVAVPELPRWSYAVAGLLAIGLCSRSRRHGRTFWGHS